MKAVLMVVVEGDIEPYKPHKNFLKHGAPALIPKQYFWKYVGNYAEHTKFKKWLHDRILEQIPQEGGFPLSGPIGLEIRHYRKIPVSRQKNTQEGAWCPQKPDESNLDKLVEDAMTGVVYLDDSQICCRPGFDFKQYSANPRVEIVVYEL